jgi:two-component system CheB/CheR fusion protein
MDLEADSAQREADQLLLARFAPASLLVDEELNILQFRGETGPYLEHASGPPSLNLHRVARPELLVEIAPPSRKPARAALRFAGRAFASMSAGTS